MIRWPLFAFASAAFNSGLPSKSSPLGSVVRVTLATCLAAFWLLSLRRGVIAHGSILLERFPAIEFPEWTGPDTSILVLSQFEIVNNCLGMKG